LEKQGIWQDTAACENDSSSHTIKDCLFSSFNKKKRKCLSILPSVERMFAITVVKKNNTWRVTNIKRKIDVHLSVEYQINHPNH
jgi:ABC-type enterochelin transport system permease subunit